jgi:TolA-binding protein
MAEQKRKQQEEKEEEIEVKRNKMSYLKQQKKNQSGAEHNTTHG